MMKESKLVHETNRIETPYFLIHVNELDNGLELLETALLTYWPNSIIGYSFKTNSLPWVIHYFKEKGCYAEVVSDDEYNLGKYYGFQNFVYNGPIKTKATFLEALNAGSIVNIDSEREIEWLSECSMEKSYKVGIRVNFDLDAICPGESACGEEGGRFGFCYENMEFINAVRRIEAHKNVKVAGLHLHCSTKTRSVDIYKAIASKACEIKKKYSMKLEYIDIGGGFFGGMEYKPSFLSYIASISDELAKEFDPRLTKLIVEPGMSLIGAPVSFVTSVIDVKITSYNTFVITDGSRVNIDPFMKKSNYFYRIEFAKNGNTRKEIENQIISGFTCIEKDRLFKLKNRKQLLAGDQIIYEKVGAYTMCLNPLFIKYLPAVYIQDGDSIKKVREKWSVENYIQHTVT